MLEIEGAKLRIVNFMYYFGAAVAVLALLFVFHKPANITQRQQKMYAVCVYVGIAAAILGAVGFFFID